MSRPGTVETGAGGGKRIFERQFYVSQNASQFITNPKVFTSVQTKENLKKTAQRPALHGYKREFSMPDNFHIDVPSR